MTNANLSRDVRERLVHALRRELMGPTTIDEAISEFPTGRYIVGRLAPARSAEDDNDAAIPETENDTLGAGTSDSEDEADDAVAPLIIGFNPSSFGLSFLIEPRVNRLCISVSWGDYRREKSDTNQNIWRRHPRSAVINDVPVGKAGPLPRIHLSASIENRCGAKVTGVDDKEIDLEGVIHEFYGYRAISLFIVNRRTKGALSDRNKDERWIYQPRISVASSDGEPVFVAKDIQDDSHPHGEDGDAAISALLYRHAREFASGHGVSAGWETPQADGRRTNCVFTEFIPNHEVPMLVAPSEQTGGANLDMKHIAELDSASAIISSLQPMLSAYEVWIQGLEAAANKEEIKSDKQLYEAAQYNIMRCKECAIRVKAGLQSLHSQNVMKAFRFANKAMWDQRVHSLWASANRKNGKPSGSPTDFDIPKNRTWRPFQIAFFLLNLRGIIDETCEDRSLVDLLWFPTGGGKTEAYLGLSAFTLAIRRLVGDRYGMSAGAGVSVIMRYTLRLLTVQQFQRAAALICACEVIRRQDPKLWGDEPFRIGVWVGRGTTPNKFSDAQKFLESLADGRRRGGSPIQLLSCPRCGISLVNEKGVPERNTYISDQGRQRTLVRCRNKECAFYPRDVNDEGLPVVVVDDELYRTCPSLIVATVDKFARLPFKGETRSLFGMRNRYSAAYGHITEAHGDFVGNRKLNDAYPVPQLLPPELIIQDELHLISGPLGTMVGLYETAVSYATALGGPKNLYPAKVIASTATIRRAAQQVRQLYGGRGLAVFPPSALSAKDSFFASEMPIDKNDDSSAGRLYVGVNAPGSSTKTLLVRVYSILLAIGAAEITTDAAVADPYGTLVGYFNSIRALGGAKRLVEDDVNLVRLKYLAQQRGFPRRYINDQDELNGRIESWKIPSLLKKLDVPFPRKAPNWPVDVLLATNMISVGVDIDRLGLMVVTGQPKTTAEYIQSTSRVGRKHPGLVVTMYNWMGARDISHYERFQAYHSALYRYVEAISVTPFSSRALDRGLRGIFASMNRLSGPGMALETDAENYDPASAASLRIIEHICKRTADVVGKDNAELVRARLLSHRDEWAHLAESLLRYSWLDEAAKPPNNSRVLLKTAGTQNEGEWKVPGSLREVEPTAAFYLEEDLA